MKRTVLHRVSIAAAATCAFMLLSSVNASAQVGIDHSGRSTAPVCVARSGDVALNAAHNVMSVLKTTGRGLQTDTPSPPSESKTDVTITTTETHWYANPVWIAIGVIGGGLLIVLIALAVRGGGKEGSSTTIVHD